MGPEDAELIRELPPGPLARGPFPAELRVLLDRREDHVAPDRDATGFGQLALPRRRELQVKTLPPRVPRGNIAEAPGQPSTQARRVC